MIPFELSDNLSHTWFFDVDGTILEHNGYYTGQEKLLPGVKELWQFIPENDTIIIISAREEEYRQSTLKFLDKNNIRYNYAIFGVPTGERIVVNDEKPDGLQTAIAWNIKRDTGFE